MKEIKFKAWDDYREEWVQVNSIIFSHNHMRVNDYSRVCDNYKLLMSTGEIDDNGEEVWEEVCYENGNQILK